jgi:hypothetical protein
LKQNTTFAYEKTLHSQEHNAEFLIQERRKGTEYIVNTISHSGEHIVTGVMRYIKDIFNNVPIYRYTETIDLESFEAKILIPYITNCLDAVSFEFGLSHNQVMLTKNGPRLIEINARMARAAGFHTMQEKISYGTDRVDVLINNLHEKNNLFGINQKFLKYTRHCTLFCFKKRPLKKFNLEKLYGLNSFKGKIKIFREAKEVVGYKCFDDKVAFVLLENYNQVQLEKDTAKLFRMEQKGELF